jgi:hypothetical protein
MVAGDCYRLKLNNSEPTPHLWIALLDPTPAAETIIVSLITIRHNCDQTVVVMPGNHPFVNRPSCVLFGDSKIVSASQLDLWATMGFAQQQSRLSPNLLQEICQGLKCSPFTPKKIISFYDKCRTGQ